MEMRKLTPTLFRWGALAGLGLIGFAASAQPGPEGPEAGGPPLGGPEAVQPGGPGGPGGPGFGGHGGPGGFGMRDRMQDMGERMIRFMSGPKAKQDLGLTDEQVKKIEAINLKAEKDSVDLDGALRKSHIDLRQAMQDDSIDRSKVMSLLEDNSKAELASRKLHATQLLDIREVLTPEQREKAKVMREEMAKRFDDRLAQRRGPGGPGGPLGAPTDKAGKLGKRHGKRGAPGTPGQPPAPPEGAPGASLDQMIDQTPAGPPQS